ncbi:helix-turn-helix domain-containing protein, partial [Phocaeicola vulgatus]|uniref:helix-turn-helix domain-containing protein n=1 Tax=Phocaeicola vulgatus TaxID=821 RepID=UPI00210A97CF
EQESEPDADVNNAPDDVIQQIIHVIEAYLANEIFNVKMLAEQLNMSPPTLYRKIKQRSQLAASDMIRS